MNSIEEQALPKKAMFYRIPAEYEDFKKHPEAYLREGSISADNVSNLADALSRYQSEAPVPGSDQSAIERMLKDTPGAEQHPDYEASKAYLNYCANKPDGSATAQNHIGSLFGHDSDLTYSRDGKSRSWAAGSMPIAEGPFLVVSRNGDFDFYIDWISRRPDHANERDEDKWLAALRKRAADLSAEMSETDRKTVEQAVSDPNYNWPMETEASRLRSIIWLSMLAKREGGSNGACQYYDRREGSIVFDIDRPNIANTETSQSLALR